MTFKCYLVFVFCQPTKSDIHPSEKEKNNPKKVKTRSLSHL